MSVRETYDVSDALIHSMRNANAKRLQIAMRDAGWINPDGYGFYFYHFDIVGPDGIALVLPAEVALHIQFLKEEKEEVSSKPLVSGKAVEEYRGLETEDES